MDADVLRIASHLWEALDTPRALACYMQAKYGEWDQLAGMRVDPSQYTNAEAYFKDAQAGELLRKADFLPLKADRKKAAEEEFLRCEILCCETNTRLDRWISYQTFESKADYVIYEFIDRVKRRIRKVLGRLPDEIVGKFGPGSTFETRGSITLGEKIQELSCTRDCVDLLCYVENTAWGRALRKENRWHIKQIPGNRFTTVPKDALKDRGICVEPGVNVFLQLGVGKHLRARLRRVGIDLDEGQAVHQRKACEGSESGALSTIDLSSASDTVSSNLVKLLLPPEWFDVLDSLRSKKTLFKGEWHYNQKFSSMGNGFTFELETLIFYALSKEACMMNGNSDDILTYGDDIIVPTGCFKEVIAVLRYFGFQPNPRKSFGEGLFRESCGGDFFNGVSVRPYYLEKAPKEPSDWIAFYNGLREIAACDSSRDLITRRARKEILACIPSHIRKCVGPKVLGDLVIHSDGPPTYRYVDGVCQVLGWAPMPKYRSLSRYTPDAQLALILYGVPSAGLLPRDSISGYGFRWIEHSSATSKWLPPSHRNVRGSSTNFANYPLTGKPPELMWVTSPGEARRGN